MAVHYPQGGGAHGGDQAYFHRSRVKSSGGTALLVVVTRQWTALTTAVYTERTSARAHSAARGGGATLEHLPLGLLSRSQPLGWR